MDYIFEVKEEDDVMVESEENIAHDVRNEFETDMVFESRQSLIDWVQQTGRNSGYVIVIRRSDIGGFGKKWRLQFKCDRGGIYQSEKLSTKATGTKKIECPFKLKGRKMKKDDDWMVEVVCSTHNHAPAIYMEGHPYPGRLSESEIQLMVDMSEQHAKPRDILSELKKRDPNNVSTIRTIYNARLKHQHARKAGKSQMQTVMSFLYDEGYFFDTRANSITNELDVQDVRADGNCGFRSIAVSLGLGEDAWPNVRYNLMAELDTFWGQYVEILGGEDRANSVRSSLNFFQMDVQAPFQYWMTIPDMGLLIASTYNVILHVLNHRGSSTYLPLRTIPPPLCQHYAIAIGHVNGNHFVQVGLLGDYPMPPITPEWVHFRHACASAWATPYAERFNAYMQSVRSMFSFNKVNNVID